MKTEQLPEAPRPEEPRLITEVTAKDKDKYLIYGGAFGDGIDKNYTTPLYLRPEPAAADSETPLIQRHYTCGCVSCICDHEERCLGCGATSCGSDACLVRNRVSVAAIPDVDALAEFLEVNAFFGFAFDRAQRPAAARDLAIRVCNWIAERTNEQR